MGSGDVVDSSCQRRSGVLTKLVPFVFRRIRIVFSTTVTDICSNVISYQHSNNIRDALRDNVRLK